MQKRMPWEIGRKVLLANGLDVGRGWPNTLMKYAEISTFDEETLNALTRSYIEHILSGEKAVKFYRVGKNKKKEIQEDLLSRTIETSDLVESYPYPLDDTVLVARKPSSPTLVAVESYDDGIAAIYSTVRVIEFREKINPENYAEKGLEQYSELIGIKMKKVQTFDVAWVPNEGEWIDIRVDYPDGAKQDNLPYIFSRITTDLGIAGTTNLFPLLQMIYGNKKEGKIVEIAFGTNTASLKNEKMRKGNMCLRDEVFHKAGTNALDQPIDIYKMGVRWPRGSGEDFYECELFLNGNQRLIHSQGSPMLSEAVFRKCMNVEDFNLIRGKIFHYLAAKANNDAA